MYSRKGAEVTSSCGSGSTHLWKDVFLAFLAFPLHLFPAVLAILLPGTGQGRTYLYAPTKGNSFPLASESEAVSLHFCTGKSRLTRFQALPVLADEGRCWTAVGKKSDF